jgi:hypothetical protein
MDVRVAHAQSSARSDILPERRCTTHERCGARGHCPTRSSESARHCPRCWRPIGALARARVDDLERDAPADQLRRACLRAAARIRPVGHPKQSLAIERTWRPYRTIRCRRRCRRRDSAYRAGRRRPASAAEGAAVTLCARTSAKRRPCQWAREPTCTSPSPARAIGRIVVLPREVGTHGRALPPPELSAECHRDGAIGVTGMALIASSQWLVCAVRRSTPHRSADSGSPVCRTGR